MARQQRLALSGLPRRAFSPALFSYVFLRLISAALLWLLLLLAGDISRNPGPFESVPVSTCSAPVFGSANVNSLTSKLDAVTALLATFSFACLALQETKLNRAIGSEQVDIPNYDFYRKDRTRNGGGVGLYVRRSLRRRQFRSGLARKLELVAAEVHLQSRRLLLGSIYRPPNLSAENSQSFISDFSDWLASLGETVDSLVLFGDLNLCSQTAEFDDLGALSASFGLSQLINIPTHGTRTIDHVYLGRRLAGDWGLGPTLEKSAFGHALTFVCLDRAAISRDPVTVLRSWNFADADWEKAEFQLEYLPDGTDRSLLDEVNSAATVQDASTALTTTIQKTLRDCVPQKEIKIRRSVPWMSKSLLRLLQRKNVAYFAWRRTPTAALRSEFKKLHKRARSAVREAKRTWALDCFARIESSADFWRVVQRLSAPRSSLPASLISADGTVAISDNDKADLFASVLAKNFNQRDCLPVAVGPDFNVDPTWICDEDFVYSELHRLRSCVATGLDGIPAVFLKKMASSIAPPLTALINRAIAEGVCPIEWKRARLAPIAKVPNSTNPAEYRPVSILVNMSKPYERWFLHCLLPFIAVHNHQFAYWPGRSTEDAIALLQHFVSAGFQQCVNVSKPTRVALVSLDVYRAFDQVPHQALLTELQRRNVPEPLLRLFRSYLQGRTLCVRVGQSVSDPTPVQSGVPQGSVLGGYAFVAYVDSIFQLPLSASSNILMFADDLILVKPIPTPEAELELCRDIETIDRGFQDLFLELTLAKSRYLICSLAPAVPADLMHAPSIRGTELARASSLKYLGCIIDRRMAFDENAKAVSTKAKRVLGVLHRSVGQFAGQQRFRALYVAKILPILTYAINVTFPRYQKDWTLLEKVNRYACRLITNDFVSSYPDLLAKLRFTSVSRITLKRGLRLLYRYVFGMRLLPGVLERAENATGTGTVRRSRRLAQDHEYSLVVPNSGVTARAGQLVPLYKLLQFWNVLAAAPDFSPDVFADIGPFTAYVKQRSVFEFVSRRFTSTFPDISRL